MGEIVRVEQGLLEGRQAEDYLGKKYFSFQGIPYAKPPIGDLRFKAPQPPVPWEGIRDAKEERDECFSHHMILKHIVGSEDCLFLNVYTPELPKSSKKLRPVMFWVHGGAFVAGSSKTEVYGPEFLLTEDVVVVTINYRLGILGFLAMEDPKLEVPGNAAFKDMVMALKWVQKNIEQFNGDPNNVTVFGESAGGASVHFLMLSPMCKGLFHKVIAQSGCALNVWAQGSRCSKLVAEKLGFISDNEAEILKYLQGVPVEKILEAQDNIYDGISADVVRSHGPVVETPHSGESFLPETPLSLILNERYNKVPLMMGYTDREGILFDIMAKRSSHERLADSFERFVPHYLKVAKGSDLSLKIANKIKEYYFGEKEMTMENIENDYILRTDLFFIRGIYKSIVNQLQTSKSPIYLYRVTVETDLGFYKKLADTTVRGVCHADELGYLWKTAFTPDIKPNSLEEKTLFRMVKLWANFAKNGNPNPVVKDKLIQVSWKPVKEGEFHFLNIGEDLLVGVNPEEDRMALWDEIHALIPHAAKL